MTSHNNSEEDLAVQLQLNAVQTRWLKDCLASECKKALEEGVAAGHHAATEYWKDKLDQLEAELGLDVESFGAIPVEDVRAVIKKLGGESE